MKNMSILWIDDDWDQPTLLLFCEQLSTKLAELNINANFDKILPNECANRLAYEGRRYSLIITDYIFERHNPPGNGTQLAEGLSAQFKNLPPIFLITNYLHNSGYFDTEESKVQFARSFTKNPNETIEIAHAIELLANAPPVNILLLSDIHCGFLGRRGDARAKAFLKSFFEDLEKYCTGQDKVDYVLISGDLAWQKQGEDLADARDFLAELVRVLNLTNPSALQFCIGNHDLNLKNVAYPLENYHNLMCSLGAINKHHVKRFVAYQPMLNELAKLKEQTDALYTDYSAADNIFFASINSCEPSVSTNNPELLEVRGNVGVTQWSALETCVQKANLKGGLRIAMLHHPLFATPGGNFEDELPIADQAQAFHRLTKLGFQIAIHGHAHFACMYEQRMSVLNPSGGNEVQQRLVVVGVPTLSADPSSSSPSRQYMLLRVSSPLDSSGERSVSLRTRSRNEHNGEWVDGGQILPNTYSILEQLNVNSTIGL